MNRELLEIRDNLKATLNAMLFSNDPTELNSLLIQASKDLLNYQQAIKKGNRW